MIQTGTGLIGLASLPSSSSAWENRRSEPDHPIFKPGEYQKIDSPNRRFHISARVKEILDLFETKRSFCVKGSSGDTMIEAADLPAIWKASGVSDIWLNPWGSGSWRSDRATMDRAVDKILSLGMTPHFLTVPFGHPSKTPSKVMSAQKWKPAHRINGSVSWGASCHSPVDRICMETVRTIADHYGPCNLFLDDDFRFADSPHGIGGCICPECRADFLKKAGYSESKWDQLLHDLRSGNDVPGVRLWINNFCDRLTKIFRDTEARSPEVDLGIMVMGMGSERAGIRLDDYRGKLFRVGEWMFTDAQYGSTKNKTIELFSSLFHRRFASPGRSFSETTIIDPLSAENFSSKQVITTFSDIRNTMFMCPIPAEYWSIIAPRMHKEARYHQRILGKKGKGPFKHYWGSADRFMAGYNAYSLFLALGVPFEVCEDIPQDGWTFLGDASARSMERGSLLSPGSQCIARSQSGSGRFTRIPETFKDLFQFRRTLLSDFQKQDIPYIEEETPIVLGWYPENRTVLLWNIEAIPKKIRLRKGDRTFDLSMAPLDSAMLIENPDGGFRLI